MSLMKKEEEPKEEGKRFTCWTSIRFPSMWCFFKDFLSFSLLQKLIINSSLWVSLISWLHRGLSDFCFGCCVCTKNGSFVSEMIFTGDYQDFPFVCTTFCSPFVKFQAWSRSIYDWRIRRKCQLKLDLFCWSMMCCSVITVKSSQALFDFLLFFLLSCFLSWSSTCCCGYCCFCDFPLKSVSAVIFFFTQLALRKYYTVVADDDVASLSSLSRQEQDEGEKNESIDRNHVAREWLKRDWLKERHELIEEKKEGKGMKGNVSDPMSEWI